MKRLIKADPVTRKDHEFDLDKAVKDFKKKHKVNDKMLENKTSQNQLYRDWSNYMLENYPIWAMSSPAYILKGWSYVCGAGLFSGVTTPFMPQTDPDNISSPEGGEN